jgi:hypothetical protein
VSARLLAVITPGDEATALASMAGLATIARAAEAGVRLAYFRPLPPPRVDRHDRPIADTDTEMTRMRGDPGPRRGGPSVPRRAGRDGGALRDAPA